jgi:alkylation response protein AidB-like acyl-CoA dehydrogenase
MSPVAPGSRSRAPTAARSADDPVEELVAWLGLNWDPDLTVAAWWERLGRAGWAAPMLPLERYGRGLSRRDALRVTQAIADFGALGPPVGLGLGMAAPTIAVHGTAEQVDRLVGGIVTGQRAWCQLFSEPGAGSDLAGLATRAVRDGALWIVNGQKVWTSGGHLSDLGMLLARTDPEVPKHQGITWFVLDMRQRGVEVRPLRQMTGGTNFNEVFLNDAVVEDANRIGEVNNGWAVANTTLHYERSGMGAGGAGPPASLFALPGTVAGHLDRRAGEFAPSRRRRAPSSAASARPTSPVESYIQLARTFGKDRDPVVRQALVRLHTLRELARMNTERHRAAVAGGSDIAGIASFSKLLMADIVRLTRDLGLQILGPRGTLHAYDDDGRAALRTLVGGETALGVTAQALGAQALPIFGGTDQIQRNIISERALGMPKEPGDRSSVPWSELPKNS